MMFTGAAKRSCFLPILLLLGLRSGVAQSLTEGAVRAADKFLATLNDDQRQKVMYAYDDENQRARWSNFPTGVVPRGGISLKQMSAQQQAAAMDLLATVLSPMGLEKVNEIRLADDDFKANGSKRGPHGGSPPGGNGDARPQSANGGPPPPGAGGPPPQFGGRGGPGGRPGFAGGELFGKDLYYISFLGKPSTTAPWMLQFGGHHLALNITIAGSRGVMTPSLTGAQPATFQLNGRPYVLWAERVIRRWRCCNLSTRNDAAKLFSITACRI